MSWPWNWFKSKKNKQQKEKKIKVKKENDNKRQKNEKTVIEKLRKTLDHIVKSLGKAVKNKDIDSVEEYEEYLKIFFRKASKNISLNDGIVNDEIINKNSNSTSMFLLLIGQILNTGNNFELGNFIQSIIGQAKVVLQFLESRRITENGFLDRKHLENLQRICLEAYGFIKINIKTNLPKERQNETTSNRQFSSRIAIGSKTISDLCKVYDSSTISIEKFGQLASAFQEVITNIMGLLKLAKKNSNINKEYEIEEINKKLNDAMTELKGLKNNLTKEKK